MYVQHCKLCIKFFHYENILLFNVCLVAIILLLGSIVNNNDMNGLFSSYSNEIEFRIMISYYEGMLLNQKYWLHR